jgi:Cu/Ag efflux protein CusF
MKSVFRVLAAVALVSSVAAVAQTKMPAAMGAASVSVTATVEDIDQPNRIVTLRGQNGDITVFKVGPEVKNLAQVKKGDVVTAEYVRAVALELRKGGDGIRSSTERSGAAAAKPGEKPAAAVTHSSIVIANVTKVDAANQLITLKGPKGNVIDLSVKDPAILAQVKVGDQVEAVVTEALMLSVSTPATKK